MILSIDIGNTLTKFGLFENGSFEPKHVYSYPTNPKSNSNDIRICFETFLKTYRLSFENIDKVSMSSVVEDVRNLWIRIINEKNLNYILCDYEGVKNIDTKLYSCAYAKPKEVGGDIIASCIAANYFKKSPCAIIDLGTATNINVVNKNHQLEGAIICAGLKTAIDSITSKASALSNIKIDVPKKLIGSSTEELIQSGAIYGEAARVDGLINFIDEELACKHNVICTGGFSNIISPLLMHKNDNMPYLVLQGLYKLAISNYPQIA